MYDLGGIAGVRFYHTNGEVTNYEYVKDAQNNVIGIVKNNQVIAKYKYDAWGNILEETKDMSDPFVQINPIRYRSYYYDIETNMYYCRSRYYVPQWCRWLNGDSVSYLNPQSINGLNLFAYCNNNPVMGIDPTGHFGIGLALLIAAIIGVSAGIGCLEYEIYNRNNMIECKDGNVEIKNSWFLQNPISNLFFLIRLRNSDTYKSQFNDDNPNKRGLFDMWIEWEAHNCVGNASFALGSLLFIPSLLVSNGVIDPLMWDIYSPKMFI